MKNFLDEPPFPRRLEGDVHQSQVIVNDVDLPSGLVVLLDDLAFQLVGRGDELETARLIRCKRQVDRLQRMTQHDRAAADLDFGGCRRLAAELPASDADADSLAIQAA